MLDGQTQLTAMFGAPERKAPQPAAPVVTPPGSRSKRKWAPANAIPPLSLPPLAKTPKKAVPPGWMRYGLAPALRVEINRVCSRQRLDLFHTGPRSAAATSAATTSWA